ncbi:MAG: hypothetical protein QXY82_04070 [Desulfurococcaceae archaeon]
MSIIGANCIMYYIISSVNILDEQAVVEFLGYTSHGMRVLGVEYRGEQGFVELTACNPGTVELPFSLSYILEEQGLGSYPLLVDTSVLWNYGNVVLELRLGIPMYFEVSLSGDTVVEEAINEEQGVLRLKGVGLFTITILIPLEKVEQTLTPVPTIQPLHAEVLPLYIAVAAIAVVIIAIAVILVIRRK